MAKKQKGVAHCAMISGGVRCLHCGDMHKLGFPIAFDEATKVYDGFAKRHKKCEKTWEQPVANPQLRMDVRIKFWLSVGEVGVSAVTMYNVFMPSFRMYGWGIGHPQDPDDFRRCYLLLQTVPEWKEKMFLMKTVSEVWAKLVDNWDTLTGMLEKAMATPDGNAPEMYELMKTIGC